MPTMHGDARSFAKFFEALVLVVDQRFQRRQVQHLHAATYLYLGLCPRVVSFPRVPPGGCDRFNTGYERREDWQECCLSLPGGGCRCDDDVAGAIEDWADGAFLGVVQ